MITEDYVSFETAKLLNEKGFDEYVTSFYGETGVEGYMTGMKKTSNSKLEENYCARPTIQMVMKWLREKHNIHIMIDCIGSKNYLPTAQYTNNSEDVIIEGNESKIGGRGMDSYEEACEAAIKYCLKNLIKNEDEEEESEIPVPKTISEIPVPKTVNEAISTLEKILSDEDRECLLENGAISMHNSLGRWIRNEWGLWTGSELKNELKKKGFEHPDDMSNYIIEEFIKYWNNKL